LSYLIRSPEEEAPRENEQVIVLEVERSTLSKRRWRGVAQDGREFGFDLDHALSDGTVFFRDAGKCYTISQAAEPVLIIELGHDPARAATVGWQIGNLHFPIELSGSTMRCADDPAIRQMLQREQIAWRQSMAVFRPFTSGGHAHHH
jgi:urease accessory protein